MAMISLHLNPVKLIGLETTQPAHHPLNYLPDDPRELQLICDWFAIYDTCLMPFDVLTKHFYKVLISLRSRNFYFFYFQPSIARIYS